MSIAASRLGIAGQFFVTPTALFAAFSWGENQETLLERLEPGSVDLGKLAALDELIAQVANRDLSPVEASKRIDSILQAPPRWGAAISTMSFALISVCAARFFGGGWRELSAALVIGSLLGMLALVVGRRQQVVRLYEPLAALFATLIAMAFAAWLPPTNVFVATLGGLIVLVPGLTLTIAMTEIATRHLVSGTARLASAAVLFLVIGVGVALGRRIGAALFDAPILANPLPLHAWTEWVALLLSPLGFTVLFQARFREVGWISIAVVLAFLGARSGTQLLGPELGVFLGALAVGVGSYLYARKLHRPASIPLVPGIIMLVPGSFGFRSLDSLLAHDVLSGMETAFTMTLVAVALVTGLLMSNVVVPPRKAL